MPSDTLQRTEAAAAWLERDAVEFSPDLEDGFVKCAAIVRELCAELKAARERIAELEAKGGV